MERSGLKLVGREPAGGGRSAALLGVFLLGAAALASGSGADASRRPVASLDLAQGALAQALERGNEDPQVRGALLEIRRTLGRKPLDSHTRTIYASLLLSLCRSLDDRGAPAFHARLAAKLAPVTVPVVERAALVLARSLETDQAAELAGRMFTYDPAAASDLLRRLEGSLDPSQIETAVTGRPESVLAWSYHLRGVGRAAEADAWLDLAHGRWPDHLPTIRNVAARAVGRADWDALAAVFPPGLVLPDQPISAPLLAYRARLHAERGDADAARRDLERALALGGNGGRVLVPAGAALEALGDHEGARHLWNRALFELPAGNDPARRNLLLQLARLEDRHGSPATALRLWRSVLELDPAHREARRRVDDLSGFRR